MKNLTVLTMLLFSLFSFGQTPELVQDYTGNTTYLAPKGWTITAQQNGNSYEWMAKQHNTAQMPYIASFVFPDESGQLSTLLNKALSQRFTNLQVQNSASPATNEFHQLLSGKRSGQANQIAVFIVRDPGKHLFVNLFAAAPNNYHSLGGADLLYRCFKYNNPHGFASTASVRGNAVATANSGTSVPSNAVGKWEFVDGYNSGQSWQNVLTGEITYARDGWMYGLTLAANGSYVLDYYHEIINQSGKHYTKVKELGTYVFQNDKLVLNRNQYTQEGEVNGNYSKFTEQKLGALTFEAGLFEQGKRFAIRGPKFEYSITSDPGLHLVFDRK